MFKTLKNLFSRNKYEPSPESLQLEKEFEKKNLRPEGGILVLSPSDAERILDEAVKREIEILGMDVFKIYNDGGIQPFMEHGRDFSSSALSNDYHAKICKRIIKSLKGKGFSFEVVLD